MNKKAKETRIKGIGASPGICIGKAYLLDKEETGIIERYSIEKSKIPDEKSRFKNAVEKAQADIFKIIENIPEQYRDHTRILEAHAAILKDPMLYDRTIDIIEKECLNSEWAVKKVVSDIKNIFKNIDDPFFRERADDIVIAADRITLFLIGNKVSYANDINRRVIIVAPILSPADSNLICMEKVKGFVTERGGFTSHTSIIARSVGVPGVSGIEEAMAKIENDDLIIVDGTDGLVIINPNEQTLVGFEEKKIEIEEQKASITQEDKKRAATKDQFEIEVMGNIELPEEAKTIADYGGDGIGLYRTEFQYISRTFFPDEQELFENYKKVFETAGTVTIRTLDINGDKAVESGFDYKEPNPALGLRGIRYCLKRQDVFMTQLRAILRASVYGKLRIMFPMISSLEEIIMVKHCIAGAQESLVKQGKQFDEKIEIGIMIEVPSAVTMAKEMAEHVDFFSIGTNDLIQYSLAIDRGNMDVSAMFNPLHPAIIRMIDFVSKAAEERGVKVFMCGEMAGDPINVPILVGMKIKGLSMNPQSIPAVKRMIRKISLSDSQTFLQKVLKLSKADDITNLVRETYGGMV